MVRHCSCGAIYELTESHIWQRDKDSLECQFCNEELIHWNGSTIWSYKLISPPSTDFTIGNNQS